MQIYYNFLYYITNLKLIYYIVVIFLICSVDGFGQMPDSISRRIFPPQQEMGVFSDSLAIEIDTLISPRGDNKDVIISPDAIEEAIDWGAADTMWFDKSGSRVHLYGDAFVKLETMNMKAGYIVFDFESSEALALPAIDASGKETQLPYFEDGDQNFTARKLRFNFKSSKGMIYDAVKKEGELFVHGSVIKYISKEADTLNHVETIYARHGMITGCDCAEPHYGIRANKLKVVPNKLAVLGFSHLEIAGIPTPAILPFGFYPMFSEERSGLIIPKNYSFHESLGYGLEGLGYYFPINDYYDLTVTGNIYTRGTWGLNVASNYKKRYKYSGNFRISYSNVRTEVNGKLERKNDHKFQFSLAHNQDRKAHPYMNIGGNISLTLNGYDKTFNTDAQTRLNNITTSNFTFSHDMPNTIFSFNGGLSHSQNNQSGAVSVEFPRATLNMRTYYPFKLKKPRGSEKWFEKININYNANLKNVFEATDTSLFTAETFKNAKLGMKHSASSSASYSVFKYFSLSPSVNYSETYFYKSRQFEHDQSIILDSIGLDVDGNTIYDTLYGQVLIDTINNIKPFRQFNTSLNLSTKQYGKLQFNKGWLRGIRHVVSYNVGFSYSPNTRDLYEVEIDRDFRDEYVDIQRYNVFINGPFGQGIGSDKQMALTYSIGNNVEGKYFSRKDSTLKKMTLLQSFNITGNYNFAADSLKFSTINMSASTSLFNNLIQLRYYGTLDPYMKENNKRVNTLVWDERKLPFRHERSSLTITTGMGIVEIIDLFSGKKEKEGKDAAKSTETGARDLLKSFRISYDLGISWEINRDNRDTILISRHVLSTQGNIKLSKKWNLTVGHIGYDIKANELTYPDIGFERDLHCWTMNFSWRPRAGHYSFFIGVNSSDLSFIQYNHGQTPLQNSLGGGLF